MELLCGHTTLVGYIDLFKGGDPLQDAIFCLTCTSRFEP